MGVLLLFGNSRRFDNLEERLGRLEREQKALALDWENVYSKVRNAMSRISKSAAIIQEHDRQEEEGTNGSNSPGDDAGGHLLTPKQRLIQQQILHRRAGRT